MVFTIFIHELPQLRLTTVKRCCLFILISIIIYQMPTLLKIPLPLTIDQLL